MEMTPLVDVVLLLLTFFIFSLVLMVRAEVLDVRLPALTAGQNAARSSFVTVAVDRSGQLFVDGEQTTIRELPADARTALRHKPEASLVIAVDGQLRSDRLLRVVDALAGAGLGEFSIIGRPIAEREPAAETQADPGR